MERAPWSRDEKRKLSPDSSSTWAVRRSSDKQGSAQTTQQHCWSGRLCSHTPSLLFVRFQNMAKVQVNNVVVLDNPSPFYNPFQFEITFECIEDLSEDLEWKIIYVGSAESEEYDQVLDSVLVGPVPAGRHMFVFQADAPNPGLIPDADAVGVTVVLITCTYRSQEFIRVGYYVNNEYTETELRENPPVKPDFSKVRTAGLFYHCKSHGTHLEKG